MANVLCQIQGSKQLILYPPSDVTQLGFPAGASSSSICRDGWRRVPESIPPETHATQASLNPGDVLFIPPCWPHSATPTSGFSIAVNVFFRNLKSGYAAGKDVYGNRDLRAYEQGRLEISKITRAFEGLPRDIGRFYLERLADELMDKARNLTESQADG